MSSDRRNHHRVNISVSADIHTGEEMSTGRVKNLSMGGVGLELERPVTAQTNVAVSLFLVVDGVEDVTSEPLEIHCQVIWVASTGPHLWDAGLRFFPLDEDQTRRLDHFLRQIGGSPPAPPSLPPAGVTPSS